MIQILIVVLSAIAGVGLYVALVRRIPNRAFFPMLGPGVLLLGIAGIGMLRLLPVNAAENPARVGVALVMLWIGWVGGMALLAQMLSRRMPAAHPWPVMAGAVATFAPVIGYIVARVMG